MNEEPVTEADPIVPAALPATVGVRTLGRGMALIMGSVFLLIVGGSLAFVFGAGIGFILGEKEGLAILCCLGLVALAVVVGLMKGWYRCIRGVAQMRQAAGSGMGRRPLTFALVLHAMIPSAALALLDPDPAKGWLLALGTGVALFAASVGVLFLAFPEAVRGAGRRGVVYTPARVGLAMCVVQVATGLAIAGCSLDLDVVGSKAISPLCVLTIVMAILAFLQLDRVAWIASAPSPDSTGNTLRGA
jgi:hypothetical protein